MSDDDTRLERLLARHRDATVVEPLPGRPALIRRDQLIVAAADLPAVEDAVGRWSDARHDVPGGALLRLRPGANVDVCDLSATLRARRPGAAVAPNHLVHVQPMWWSGPFGPPRPAPAIPAPPIPGSGALVTTRWPEAAGDGPRRPVRPAYGTDGEDRPGRRRYRTTRPAPRTGARANGAGVPPAGTSGTGGPPAGRDGAGMPPVDPDSGGSAYHADGGELPDRPDGIGPADGRTGTGGRHAEGGGRRRPVTVAVLDTGLSPHPWYARTSWYAEQREEVAEVLDADLDHELDSRAGHGTFVAGVVLQHAPAARIRAKRVASGDGVGDELGVLRALAWLASWGAADVVNLSIGCHTYDDRPSPVVARAIAALGPRTAVVACAGNHASDRPYWPAALDDVIAVAALDGEERARFSNYGPWVDACAPGVDVASCFVRFNGPRPRVNGTDPDDFTGFAIWSGTSFAAPAVAGAIARVAAETGLPGRAAAQRVLDPAHRRAIPGLGLAVIDPGESDR